eukprot:6463569-Amphidinium_carterae.1
MRGCLAVELQGLSFVQQKVPRHVISLTRAKLPTQTAKLGISSENIWRGGKGIEDCYQEVFVAEFCWNGNAYQLLNLIGKGGFSEVYRAFDVEAVKR